MSGTAKERLAWYHARDHNKRRDCHDAWVARIKAKHPSPKGRVSWADKQGEDIVEEVNEWRHALIAADCLSLKIGTAAANAGVRSAEAKPDASHIGILRGAANHHINGLDFLSVAHDCLVASEKLLKVATEAEEVAARLGQSYPKIADDALKVKVSK